MARFIEAAASLRVCGVLQNARPSPLKRSRKLPPQIDLGRKCLRAWAQRQPRRTGRRAHRIVDASLKRCALAVAWPDGPAVVVEGRVDGVLTFPPRGDRGFGYDPIFQPQGLALTFGEMDPAAKDAMSHRARAFARLKAALL